MKLLALIILASTIPINAQTAKVIALSPADAAEAKYLYEQRDAINKRIEDLHKKVADKYLSEEKPGPGVTSYGYITSSCGITFNAVGEVVPCPPPTEAEKAAAAAEEERRKKMHHLERLSGWSNFEFSENFKFIVPASTKLSTCSYYPGYYAVPTQNLIQ